MSLESFEAAEEIKRQSLDLGSGNLSKWVSLTIAFTAILSAFAGIMSARCTTRGLVAKNDSILKQDEATNRWSYFQSRNVRLEIAETQTLIVDLVAKVKKPDLAAVTEKIERFKTERDQAYNEAKILETERDQLASTAGRYLEVSRDFAVALTILQVALLLIPISLVTKKKQNFFLGAGMSLAGLLVLLLAYKTYFNII